MSETDLATPAADFATARRVAGLLEDEGIHAAAEEYEIGMAHVRLDPEDETPNGYLALIAETDEDEDGFGWVMVPTCYDEDMHTYEPVETAAVETLDVPADADPADVAEAILNFIS